MAQTMEQPYGAIVEFKEGGVPLEVSGGLTDSELRASPLEAISPNISVASAFAGRGTVTTPGTAEQGADIALTNGVWIKALAANTGVLYLWHATGDGRTGFELSAGEVMLVNVANLNEIWFDAAVGGEGYCWLKA